MITLASVGKSFGDRALWEGLTHEFQATSMTAIIGPSGSGKTTLLNCIGGFARVDSGRIYHQGKDITTFSAKKRRLYRRNTLGYLFQDYALIDNETALENVRLAVLNRGSKELAAQALRQVGLGEKLQSKVHTLSGGEQQRVAVARLLVRTPDVILADEPTGALDHANEDDVLNHLRNFANSGATVIISTHSDKVINACDGVLNLGA